MRSGSLITRDRFAYAALAAYMTNTAGTGAVFYIDHGRG
jgi:hypothetical protein